MVKPALIIVVHCDARSNRGAIAFRPLQATTARHRSKTMTVSSIHRGALVALLFTAANFAAAPELRASRDCAAAPFVNTAAQALMKAASAGTPDGFSSAVARYSDIRSIALYALGPYRSKLPKARQHEYVMRTKAYIGRFLAENARRFSATGIVISSCKGSAGKLLVDSRLSTGERILWRLATSGNNYRVEDVSVQQVWLAQQLRTNFVHMIRTSGESVDALIDKLG